MLFMLINPNCILLVNTIITRVMRCQLAISLIGLLYLLPFFVVVCSEQCMQTSKLQIAKRDMDLDSVSNELLKTKKQLDEKVVYRDHIYQL